MSETKKIEVTATEQSLFMGWLRRHVHRTLGEKLFLPNLNGWGAERIKVVDVSSDLMIRMFHKIDGMLVQVPNAKALNEAEKKGYNQALSDVAVKVGILRDYESDHLDANKANQRWAKVTEHSDRRNAFMSVLAHIGLLVVE